MGNIRSIREFQKSNDDDFWETGVGAEAMLLAPDGTQVLHWASYAQIMDYIAVAFYAKKMFADLATASDENHLSEEEREELVTSATRSLRDALDSIVFKVIDSEEMTEEDTAQMEAEYNELSKHTEEDE